MTNHSMNYVPILMHFTKFNKEKRQVPSLKEFYNLSFDSGERQEEDKSFLLKSLEREHMMHVSRGICANIGLVTTGDDLCQLYWDITEKALKRVNWEHSRACPAPQMRLSVEWSLNT